MTADSVVLLHGWPGSTADYRRVIPKLGTLRVVTVDLLGFGGGYTRPVTNEEMTPEAHTHRILELIRREGLRPVVAGYDIGSRLAQMLARAAPEEIAGIVITPAYPGIGSRQTEPEFSGRYWYQHFHRSGLAADLIDGNEAAVRTYLGAIWRTWGGDGSLSHGPEFDRLVAGYSRPGAFRASIGWYSTPRGYAGATPVTVPSIMLWPGRDELFPVEWADRIPEWFPNGRVIVLPESGHFVPLEAPDAFADAILDLAT